MIDHREYTIGVPAEELSEYCPGGYHPVRLNDVVGNGRYKIVHKLGFGSFSTVWLGWDNRDQRNVSIKVVVASNSDKTNYELGVLRTLKERGNPNHPGRKHVSHLLDSFCLEGPNGRHLCLVLELLGPNISSVLDRCQNRRLDGNLARSISQQLFWAIDYIHSAGVVHGAARHGFSLSDYIHMGNVLFRLPEFELSPTERIIQDLGPPQVGKVARLDGAPLEKGVPEYLVEPAKYSDRIYDHLHDVQLVDFGESFFVSCPRKQICTSMPFHPPELVFQKTLSNAVDIWGLGSATYELVTGRTLFEAFFDDRELIPQFQKVIGGVPERWIEDVLKDIPIEDLDYASAEYFLPLEEEVRRSYFDGYESKTLQLGGGELEALGRYLRKLLVVNPEQRATTKELLHDQWVSEGSRSEIEVA